MHGVEFSFLWILEDIVYMEKLTLTHSVRMAVFRLFRGLLSLPVDFPFPFPFFAFSSMASLAIFSRKGPFSPSSACPGFVWFIMWILRGYFEGNKKMAHGGPRIFCFLSGLPAFINNPHPTIILAVFLLVVRFVLIIWERWVSAVCLCGLQYFQFGPGEQIITDCFGIPLFSPLLTFASRVPQIVPPILHYFSPYSWDSVSADRYTRNVASVAQHYLISQRGYDGRCILSGSDCARFISILLRWGR